MEGCSLLFGTLMVERYLEFKYAVMNFCAL
jgi:hypothetical protein